MVPLSTRTPRRSNANNQNRIFESAIQSNAAHPIATSLVGRLNLADERRFRFIGIYAEDFQVVKHWFFLS
jgi:hypothetical protein